MVMFVSDRDPVCPGDRIGRDGTDCISGSGTHVWQGSVVASVVGELRCERTAAGRLPVASVRVGSRSEGPAADVVSAIAIGDEVLCRVRRLNPRYATCDVLCRGTKPLLKNFSGLIRVQDVRATEIDKVSLIFLPPPPPAPPSASSNRSGRAGPWPPLVEPSVRPSSPFLTNVPPPPLNDKCNQTGLHHKLLQARGPGAGGGHLAGRGPVPAAVHGQGLAWGAGGQVRTR